MWINEYLNKASRVGLRNSAWVAIITGVWWLQPPGFGAENPAVQTRQILPAENQSRLIIQWNQIQGVEAAYESYRKAPDEGRSEARWKAYTQTNDATVPLVLAAVRQAPNDPGAVLILEWIITNGRIQISALETCGVQAVELLRDHHVQSTNLSAICKQLGWNWDPMSQPAIDFLQGVAAKNPDRNLRGQASFVLARLAKQWAEGIAYAANSTNAPDLEYLKEYQKVAQAQTAEEAFKKAEARFEEVIAKYASCPNFPAGPGLRNPKPKLGDQAAVELFECRHLELGRKAPDIEAKDLDGVKFKLSDYRGKVVMISFWATWCGPCMQMVPHEKELVERFKSRPFALLGVNGDDRTATAKKVVEQEGMTWRSFWNGGAWNGAISTAWNVAGWPTVYVLDAQGIIRYKLQGNGGKRTEVQLNEVIERWVRAAETAKP